jgi:hypothetical protein
LQVDRGDVELQFTDQWFVAAEETFRANEASADA